MKFLNFNFGHRFKGHANLLQLATSISSHYTMDINGEKSNLLQVPIDFCSKGKWRLTLDWEYDGKSYFHQREFEVKK